MMNKMKKIRKAFLSLVLAAACMAGLPGTALAGDALQLEEEQKHGNYDSDWVYLAQKDGTVWIAYYRGQAKCDELEMPAEIDGRVVTGFMHNINENEYVKINTLIIPETVTHFPSGSIEFGGVKEIIVKEGNPVYRSEDGIVYDKQMKTLICCPTYREGELTVPEGVEKIGRYAFDRSSLSEICLPDSLREIGAAAFSNCSSRFKEPVIPSQVNKIGYDAFSGCREIKEIRLPEGIKTISDGMFNGCRNLSDIYIPESVENIGEYAFSGCKKLETIHLPMALKSIGESAFSHCDRLNHVVIPEGVTTIGSQAFSDCGRLENIYIPDSVKKIKKDGFGFSTFYNSDKVTIECSDKSYAKSYAVKNGIPYRIVKTAQPSRLGLTVNGQSVKDGQALKVKTKKSYTLQAMRRGTKEQVKWKTSNAKVAAVKAGKVTVKKAGSATITATAPDGKKTCIKLAATKAAVRVSKVQVSGSKSMKRGSRQVLGLAVAPATADNTKVSWKSSDAKVATVDKKGKVTAKKKGTVVITAAAKDKSGKKGKIKITVK